jgi:polysaccharide chain length determinant protein (PEP-CTERM system associated)
MKAAKEPTPLNLGGYWVRICRGRWIVGSCLLLGWAAGTTAGWFVPAKYRSETVILIEQQKVPEHYVEANVPADLQQRLQSMSQQILSRTRLLNLIDEFQLYRNNNGSPIDPDSAVERMRKDIGVELIKTDGRRDELSAFKVSYSAPTATLARQVTGELTSFFISENLRNREELSEDTTSFLESQLDDARKSLADQEQKLRQFRSRYLGELPEQMQGNLQILGGLQAQLQASTDALNQAEQQHLYLRSLLAQYQAAPTAHVKDDGSGNQSSPLTLDEQLESLKAQLAELSGRYTPRYPDIVRLREQIAQLELQKSRALEDSKVQKDTTSSTAVKSTAPLNLRDNSPLIQITGQLSANELEIANHKAKIKRLEEQIEQYQARLNAAPVREQESASITRDYDQSRSYYDSLLAKKLQSEMATNLEKRREGEQFRMIDPPNLPERPYWPNRLGFSVAGLGMGLGVGLGIVLLRELVTPRIYREDELTDLVPAEFTLGVPVLATDNDLCRQSRLRTMEGIAAGVASLVMLAGTLFAYYKP